MHNHDLRSRGRATWPREESLARASCRRLRLAWSGEWAALWDKALGAVFDVGQAPARTVEDMLALDVTYVREALAEEGTQNAFRRVDGMASLAPDSKATHDLPGLFPERATGSAYDRGPPPAFGGWRLPFQ